MFFLLKLIFLSCAGYGGIYEFENPKGSKSQLTLVCFPKKIKNDDIWEG
jgi:hypothetical protein